MIIAEIGANHCGDMELAKKLIRLAKEDGADLVKFQLYSVQGLSRTPETLKILKQAELTFENAVTLYKFGQDVGVEVFFTPFDVERVKWCERIGVHRYKVASRLQDKDTLDAIKETKKQTIVSVAPNYNRIKGWADEFYNVYVLYCQSKYPTPLDTLHLNNIDYTFDYQGFSDHTIGLDAAKIALARGAEIIEKHFAIDHSTGVDAPWSMTPDELAELKRWEGIVKQVL